MSLKVGVPQGSVEEDELPVRKCPKARRGSRRKEHEPHEFIAGEYLPVGDLGFPARCLGWTVPNK